MASLEEKNEWPTLVEEGKEMICTSTLVYGLAALRELARRDLLTTGDSARVLSLPITFDDVLSVAHSNRKAILENTSEGESDMYHSAFFSLQSSIQQAGGDGGENDMASQVQVVAFDDENSKSELVYGIEINHVRKRITVGFRGSVTVKDFMVDAKSYIRELPNPLFPPDSNETIGIHHGFYEYLFETKSLRDGTNGKNKRDLILEQISDLFEMHPNYRLYTTGHSLGMALATLFAAEAASLQDSNIPKPVTCIGIGSPKVGNRSFLRCFQSLERKGLVRCLRIQNYGDAITVLPDQARDIRCLLPVGDRAAYTHVGLQITIDKNGVHEFAYSRDRGSKFSRALKNGLIYFGHDLGVLMMLPVMVCHAREFLKNHNCGEYHQRFEKFAETNSKELYLNDVYRDDVPACDGEFTININDLTEQ